MNIIGLLKRLPTVSSLVILTSLKLGSLIWLTRCSKVKVRLTTCNKFGKRCRHKLMLARLSKLLFFKMIAAMIAAMIPAIVLTISKSSKMTLKPMINPLVLSHRT